MTQPYGPTKLNQPSPELIHHSSSLTQGCWWLRWNQWGEPMVAHHLLMGCWLGWLTVDLLINPMISLTHDFMLDIVDEPKTHEINACPTAAQDGNGCIECTLKESSLIARGLPFHFRPLEPGAAPVVARRWRLKKVFDWWGWLTGLQPLI